MQKPKDNANNAKHSSVLSTASSRNELVVVSSNQVYTTSRIVANRFGKQHGHVLRAIYSLGQSIFGATSIAREQTDFFHNNFKESWYKDTQGRRQSIYKLTKDGFAFLVMGFTGAEAAKFKIEFINAFNAMEEKLKKAEPCMREMMRTIKEQEEIIAQLKGQQNTVEVDPYEYKWQAECYASPLGSVKLIGDFRDGDFEMAKGQLLGILDKLSEDCSLEIYVRGWNRPNMGAFRNTGPSSHPAFFVERQDDKVKAWIEEELEKRKPHLRKYSHPVLAA